jgi:diguanylate cyclase (GGDEF)-like protein
LQVHRLQVLNTVAKSVSSSLEIKQVITLLNSTIQNALDADTYYVGLTEDEGKALHLELLYDEGEFYPLTYLPLHNTLAGWVIRNRKSLVSCNLPEDMPKLGLHRFVVGQQRASLSWMGTPLKSGDRILGLVAVASYKRDEFGTEDLELLENVAQQASLAIDNAYHHAEVEQKSRMDSLTGAYNHRAFIQKLDEGIATSDLTNLQLSVIMLDIDHFKIYNDSYGHLVGDKVLSRLTEVIRSHIRESDFVGRWGGEEFSIALQTADVNQASVIAQRIQKSMSVIEFITREGSSIPAPTVSQGIATYPVDADGTYGLIDAADQRLYIAKNRGRNEIEPHIKEVEPITKPD